MMVDHTSAEIQNQFKSTTRYKNVVKQCFIQSMLIKQIIY